MTSAEEEPWFPTGDGQNDPVANEITIVVVEDDPNIADLLDMYLRKEGWRVLSCPDGERGLDLVSQSAPRVVILDVGLAGEIDGLEVCRRLRSSHPDLGVIMLTARDEEIDRVLGLELGADDYVTKPFSPREMVARVKALLRRSEPRSADATPAIHTLGAITVDSGRREATRDGDVVPLATREFDLLMYLCDQRGLALSRQQLLDAVWGDGWIGDERTVDVHVRQLRRKLGDDLDLATVWGVGYRLG